MELLSRLHANVLQLISDTKYEVFFRMNTDKSWFCSNTHLFHIMQSESVLSHLMGYNILSFRKLTFDESRVVVKDRQLPMLLIYAQCVHKKKNSSKGNVNTTYMLDRYLEIVTLFKQSIEKSKKKNKERKNHKNSKKLKKMRKIMKQE